MQRRHRWAFVLLFLVIGTALAWLFLHSANESATAMSGGKTAALSREAAKGSPPPEAVTGTVGPGGIPAANSVHRETLRANPEDKERLDALNIESELQALTEEAKTNPSLAYALAMALSQCSFADSAYESLSEAVGSEISAMQAAHSVSTMDKIFRKCAGMKGMHLDLQYDLLGFAARGGVLEAQLSYRAIGGRFVLSEEALRKPGTVAEYVSNTRNFTTRAAATGDPAGLYNAYALFSDGKLIQPDPVLAYRYLSRFNRVRSNPSTRALLDKAGASLTPEQLKAATR